MTRARPSSTLSTMRMSLLNALLENTKSTNAKLAVCAESIRPSKRNNNVLKRDWRLGWKESSPTQSRIQVLISRTRTSIKQIKLWRAPCKQILIGTLTKRKDRRNGMSKATKSTSQTADAFVRRKDLMTKKTSSSRNKSTQTTPGS